ncbi:glucosamine-6-phosphate deaminase [Sporosarcina sp. G11-34]|uniref:glucosamine-6-phosphate deaminase n=1 Tax=Sporosarcina sp. G11-34 TaxID=2849605 RepID=UPI0022A9D080|nr:glucosamine-6-phosphate deaminase [Sporosarcina sp. G11-34]MCZ2258556.1 glucosamine-6-phosphate deaminase [Sporosarcina sp. G11-34]
MKVITVENQEQGAQKVLEMMKEQLDAGKLDVLGLATGSTMIPIYEKWVESDLSFENVTTFNLDEYVSLEANDKNSYSFFMDEHLFGKKKFKKTYIPNGVAEDLEAECAAYEELLRQHPLDVQFLGIGVNGHIAFNEPGTSFESVTHIAQLTDSTLGVNSQFFDNDKQIPDTALTMGIASVLAAKKIILLVFGEKKRFALKKLMEGKTTTEYPVTALIKHSDVTVITDIKDLVK